MPDPSKNNRQTIRSTKNAPMPQRGVSRPTHKSATDNKKDNEQQEKYEKLKEHHANTLWVYWMLVLLGIWLLLSPVTFSYAQNTVLPAGGRSVWLPLKDRVNFFILNDIVSGALLIFFSLRALSPRNTFSLWACCLIGIWLSIAPVIFWAPSAFIYMNDTMIGILVMSLSILIPGMPGMVLYMKMGANTPDGWSYNPSSWPQRGIMIATGFLGFVVSRYLAAYQLGYINHITDPFFGAQSEQVLTSSMSRSLPVSDAALGALAYTFEFLMGWMGGPARWRTMPWMVCFFGILVIPLGLVHIFLVISQPITVGAWCTYCLLAAAVMLPMIPLEVDEVIAMGQHIVQARRNGERFWPVFWKGGTPVSKQMDERTEPIHHFHAKPVKVSASSVWGMRAPRTLLFSMFLGIYLMFAPAQFNINIQAPIADLNHLCGALIVVVSVISMAEVIRTFRFANILTGLCLAVLPWLINNPSLTLSIIDIIAGCTVIALAIPRGSIKERYGLWDKYIR